MHEIAAEVGYDFSHERYVEASPLNIHSARLFAGYTGTLSGDTSLIAAAELLTNLNAEEPKTGPVDAFGDNRLTGKTGITTKLASGISFRFAFTAKYDSAPAPRPALSGPGALPFMAGFVPEADKLDTITEMQLIVNIL
jgi:hypothetical protein